MKGGLAGNNKILTINGEYFISDLCGETVKVWNGMHYSHAKVSKVADNQPLIKVFAVNEYDDIQNVVYCTRYQNFYLYNGDKIHAGDLKIGNHLLRYMSTNHRHCYHRITAIEPIEGGFDTYLVNEPIRSKIIVNGILVD